jgi:hypothetical protein
MSDILDELHTLLSEFPSNSISICMCQDEIRKAQKTGNIAMMVATSARARAYIAEVRKAKDGVGGSAHSQVKPFDTNAALSRVIGESLATAYGKTDEAGIILLKLAGSDADLASLIVDAGVKAVVAEYLAKHPGTGIGKPFTA